MGLYDVIWFYLALINDVMVSGDSIVERFAFELEMQGKRKVGKKPEDAVRFRKLELNAIDGEMI